MLKNKTVVFLSMFISLLLSGFESFSQNAIEQYISQYAPIAVREQVRTGVPAAITLAQGVLESGSGKGRLAINSNNHFGIKCKTDWIGGVVFHDDDSLQECFRYYVCVEDSYRDHSDFLVQRAHYSFLFSLPVEDYVSWAKGLKKAGYATNPSYPNLLIGLIEKYELNRFSLLASGLAQNKVALLAN